MTSPLTLLLVGSPKPGPSTSGSLAAYLSDVVARHGRRTETLSLIRLVKTEEGRATLIDNVSSAETVVLIFPLYIDSLPWPVIRGFEIIGEDRDGRNSKKDGPKRLATVVNCGFPESQHNELAIDICRTFARKTGFEWAGALKLGAGGFISGNDLSKMGGPAINVKAALDSAGTALASGKGIPQDAMDLMAKPVMPRWMYLFIANYGWRYMAFKNRALLRIRARPYWKGLKVRP